MAMKGRSEIEGKQLERLRFLLGELRQNNAFYRPKLEAAGLDGGVESLEAFCAAMAFTTKMDLVWDREEHPPYGSNLTYPRDRYCRYHQSSGTTSEPMAYIDTEESWNAMLDTWERVFEAARIAPDEAIFFAFSFGPFLGFWTAFDAAVRRGNLSIPGGGFSSASRIETMRANGATALCCTPTYAIRLGEILRESGGEPLPVRKIIVAGEPGGSIPETRARIEELWNGAKVFDHHGMTEVGPVSFEDPSREMCLCIAEEAFLAEVIDAETQKEVAEGETGELVLTTLTRTAAPLLRYRTGDLVRKGYADLADGSGEAVLALEGGILGRLDEMVVIRGVNIYPTAIEKVIRGISEVAEYQVTQTTRDSMAELKVSVEAVPEAAAPDKLVSQVEAAFDKAFALRIPVSLVEAGSLPRFEFKSKRWIRS
jgi:phenylacetate-CoA ligase